MDTRLSDALRAILITATDTTRIQNFVRPFVEVALELEQQVESLRAERDAVRDALLDAVQLLSVVPMSFPYNDRSQEVRAKAHIALNGIYAARKPVSQPQAPTNIWSVALCSVCGGIKPNAYVIPSAEHACKCKPVSQEPAK